jgi:hypothetical protein
VRGRRGGIVTREVVRRKVVRREIVTRKAVTREAVTREIVTRKVVTREAVTREAVIPCHHCIRVDKQYLVISALGTTSNTLSSLNQG